MHPERAGWPARRAQGWRIDMKPLSSLPPSMEPRPSADGRLPRFRLMLAAFVLSLWALVIFVRLVQLQLFERTAYEKRAARQSERTLNLDPRRGPILDRS